MLKTSVGGDCSVCGARLAPTATFCPDCGTPVERAEGVACPACREVNRPSARFCSTCGAHMASVAEAERRIVTVLFADLSGFTPLTEELDAETVHDLIAGCLGPLCDCVTRCGGFVDKFIGDCVMALFGAPVAYENEEERAIRAAIDMHRALAEWAESRSGDRWAAAYQPRLSIGINTGPVVTGLFSGGGAHNYTAVGDAVNVAARLQGLCEPGRILVGPMTYRHAQTLFEFDEELTLKVKGRQEPVRARYVVGVRQDGGRGRGIQGASTPLVGRARELAALRERWSLARAGRAQICLIVGPAGIGKTRLIEELAAAEGIGPAQLVRGRSYPYANSTPWEPLAELIRELYGVGGQTSPADAARQIADTVGGDWEDEEVASLAALFGGPTLATSAHGADELQERATSVLCRVLSWQGRAPRLLVLEDLHWADGSTLAFLTGLSASDLSGPILLALITRPPLTGETRVAALVEDAPHRIDLSPLQPEETRELVNRILGSHDLPSEALDAVVARADGMPLFVEELLKTLMASGSLERGEDGTWTAAGDWSLAVPDTIESVLSTRIDALPPAAKRTLQLAAIVGRRFWTGVLSDSLVGGPVEGEMDALREAAFIRERAESLIPSEHEHRFEHLMLQEVAYEGLLRSSREEMHGAVAHWLEDRVTQASPETDDLIAYHYERSRTPHLALPFLERGAHEAWVRGGLEDARAHLERALGVCGAGEARARVLLEMERLAALAGDAEGRASALAALETLAEESQDPELAAEVLLRAATAAFDRGDLPETRLVGGNALAGFEALGDISKQGDVLRLLGREAHQRGDHERSDALYESALVLEREAGDRWGEAEILDLRGMLELDRDEYEAAVAAFELVIGICREIDDPLLEARARAHAASALRWMGSLDQARAEADRALERAVASGSPRTRAACELVLGGIEADAGHVDEARALLRRSLRAAVRMTRPVLEAEAWLELAWLTDGPEGVKCAREAAGVAERTELVHVEILAASRLAELLLEAGEAEDSMLESKRAVEALERHGSIVGPEERVLLAQSRALAATGQRLESAEVRAALDELIARRAERIQNAERRDSYLERCRRMIEGGSSRNGAAPERADA